MHKFLFYIKFIIFVYVKIVLYSTWYHHTETSELSKITKVQFCKYEHIVVKVIYEYMKVLIFIELNFSNFRPLSCFNVTIPDAVKYNLTS